MRKQGQEKTAEGFEPGLSHLPDNRSGSPSGHKSPVLEIERSGSERLTKKKTNPTALVRIATGPRTPEGKERSKRNALKHGILSEVVVLKGEPHAKYESLLKGLWENLQPEGKLEEILVEKLAVNEWRRRRLLVAEGAEIQKGREFFEWDQQNLKQKWAEEVGGSSLTHLNGGLIREILCPDVLERCLELLSELREGFEADGFNADRDGTILKKIYGEGDDAHLRETLYDSYFNWLNTADASEEERQREGFATPKQCKQNVLHEIDAEIRRLKDYQKTYASILAKGTELETLRRSVPDSPGLDRLLRYEASLERAFDRTLSQLEDRQRMRLGQPVPPPIKVQLSS
jgi:hypothetical protein